MSALVNPPFNYTGSKFPLLAQILPLFDRRKSTLVDLFCGGGSVYINAAGDYSRVIVNDRIDELVGCHRALMCLPGDFVAVVKSHCVAKDDEAGYLALREKFNCERTSAQLFALMLCCTNNMMRFNRSLQFNQTFGRRTFNESTQQKIDRFVAALSEHAGKIEFRTGSFETFWPENPADTFVYCDPPYEGTSAGYNCYWERQREHDLFDYLMRLHRAGASWALSGVGGGHKGNPESPVIRRLIGKGFHVTELDHDYSGVARNKEAPRGREVLIRNYS